VDLVRGNGCTDEQISFENNIVSGYTNTNAPADYSCHIFHPDGGGLTWLSPPTGASPTNLYVYTTNNVLSVFGTPFVGTNERELMFIARVNYNVAMQLMELLGQPSVTESGGSHNMGYFVGDYGAAQTSTSSGVNNAGFGPRAELGTQNVFCDGPGGQPCSSTFAYYFYRVLVVR
jgi:hypothetical protein